MRTTRRQAVCLIVIFLTLLGLLAPVEIVLALRAGDMPEIADLFRRAPTQAKLKQLQRNLESRCRLGKAVRPWVQLARFVVLRDVGDKAVLGRDGWLFYRPAVRYLIEPWTPEAGENNIFNAIVSFRDDLAKRGIRLVVMPVPNKASIFPDKLAVRATETCGPVNPATRAVLARLQQAGVEIIDLFEIYGQARHDPAAHQCYLAQDSHWSPEGMRRAAAVAAQRLLESGLMTRGTAPYQPRPVTLQRYGDVLRMIRVPQIERFFEPERIDCTQIVDAQTRRPYADDPNSPVLVLGDSFLRIFERDEPGNAGFVAHLACHLGFGLTSVINDGGASTLVRQQVANRPALLEGKRIVLWEFVERDIRFGTEGWQIIGLP